jgi:hypothetical protein
MTKRLLNAYMDPWPPRLDWRAVVALGWVLAIIVAFLPPAAASPSYGPCEDSLRAQETDNLNAWGAGEPLEEWRLLEYTKPVPPRDYRIWVVVNGEVITDGRWNRSAERFDWYERIPGLRFVDSDGETVENASFIARDTENPCGEDVLVFVFVGVILSAMVAVAAWRPLGTLLAVVFGVRRV